MPTTPVVLVLLVTLVYGLARSMQFSTLATLAYADISQAQKSAASTLWSVAQQMTIGMGIAFGALGLRIASYFNGAASGVDGVAHFTVMDFHWAFVMAGVLILLSTLGYRGLAKDAGSNLGGGMRAPSATGS